MVVQTSLKKLIQDLKRDSAYKNWLEQFRNWVATKDMENHYKKYFLLYDIATNEFAMRYENDIHHNQIILWEAWLPPKRYSDKPIEFNEYKYNSTKKEEVD